MGARPGELLLEVLHVVHEGLALGHSCAVLRGLALVLQMGLVHPWRWELGYFLGDEIADPLPAGIPLFLLAVLLDEAGLLVEGRAWCLLGPVEVCLPALRSELAPRVAGGRKIRSRCSHVVIRRWGFLSLSEVLPDSRADDHPALPEQFRLLVVIGGGRLVGVVVEGYLLRGLALVAHRECWRPAQDLLPLYRVILRSGRLLIVVDEFLAHGSLRARLSDPTLTVM